VPAKNRRFEIIGGFWFSGSFYSPLKFDGCGQALLDRHIPMMCDQEFSIDKISYSPYNENIKGVAESGSVQLGNQKETVTGQEWRFHLLT